MENLFFFAVDKPSAFPTNRNWLANLEKQLSKVGQYGWKDPLVLVWSKVTSFFIFIDQDS